MTQPDARRSLQLVDAEQTRLCDRLVELTPSEMERASNLSGWRVVDLAVHITRVCENISTAVQRATTGDSTPVWGPAAREREAEIRNLDPGRWVELQRQSYRQLVQIVDSLSADQLAGLTFPHPQGERSIEWYCTQLLAEVGYHRWDLEHSLGAAGPLHDDLASYLLPFLLDPDRTLFHQRRTDGDRQLFHVATPSASWVLTTDRDGTRVRAGDTAEGPTIAAAPGWLALALYGRIRVDSPAFRVVGPIDTADRFAAIFGPH